jgi:hypothetical protein
MIGVVIWYYRVWDAFPASVLEPGGFSQSSHCMFMKAT